MSYLNNFRYRDVLIRENAQLQFKIKSKDVIIKEKEMEISELQSRLQSKDAIIIEKENSVSQLLSRFQSKDAIIKEKEMEISELQSRLQSKDEIMHNLKESYTQKEKEINDLEKQNENLLNQNEKLNNYKEKTLKDKMELEYKFSELDNKIKKIEEYSDKSINYKNKNSEEFYDVIIRINSIKQLNEGWEILMNDRGKLNYQQHKTQKYVKIGVIGNENKGKSTILQQISKYELPTGHSIKTEGLSIKYPELDEYKNLKIVLLDSAGLESPVLKDENNDEITKTQDEQINKTNKFIEQSIEIKF